MRLWKAASNFVCQPGATMKRPALAPRTSNRATSSPDTDTPLLAAEEKIRPEATRRISEGAGLWKPEDVEVLR